MRKRKTTAGKIILSLCLAFMFVLTIAMPASSAGWFTKIIYVDGTESTTSADMSISSAMGSLMSGNLPVSSFMLNTAVNEFALNAEQQTDLLIAASEGEFEQAEDMLAGFAADNYNNVNLDVFNGLGYKSYQLEYNFTYDGSWGGDIYVRFKPIGWYANSIAIDGIEYFCVQNLAYDSGFGLENMKRLAFMDEEGYYYYPNSLSAGETVKLIYTLFLTESDAEKLGGNISDYFNDYELTLINNNASIIRWNIMFDSGIAFPFDDSTLMNNEYYDYIVSFTPPVILEPIIDLTTEPETEITTEPETESTEETTAEITTAATEEPITETTTEIETETETVTETTAEIETETVIETTTESETEIETKSEIETTTAEPETTTVIITTEPVTETTTTIEIVTEPETESFIETETNTEISQN